MKKLLERLTNLGTRAAAEAINPRFKLAAFGKHPGWDDHMLGIGVETEALAHLKQILYVEGIGGQIDSGAWEKLEADKRLDGFDHLFIWLRGEHVITGCFWSSTDRKGRSKYPMVIGIDGEGVAPASVMKMVQPVLKSLRVGCMATTLPEQVAVECQKAQDELQAALADYHQGGTFDLPPTAEARKNFLECPELGPDRLGLLRVLHELNSKCGDILETPSPPKSNNGRSGQVRLPLGNLPPDAAMLMWSTLLKCVVSESWALLFIARPGSHWLDLIIGEPSGEDFFCLQASPKALPLANEIPYEFSAKLKEQLKKIEAAFLAAESPVRTPSLSVSTKSSPLVATALNEPKNGLGKMSWSSRKPWIASALIIILILLITIMILSLLSKGDKTRPPTLPPIVPTTNQSRQISTETKHQLSSASDLVKMTNASFENEIKAAQVALEANQINEASDHVTKARELKPNDPELVELSARITQRQQFAKADEEYTTALNAAQRALDAGLYNEAMAQAQAALGVKPADEKAAELEDKIRQAKAEFAARQDENYEKLLQDAQLALAASNYDASIKNAQAALKLKPGKGEAQQIIQLAQKSEESLKPGVIAANATKNFTNSFGMEFVWVPMPSGGGVFMGKYEVTQRQFSEVMGGVPGDQRANGDDLPVANVSFADANQFCKRMSMRENKNYFLPTKEEWLAAAGLSDAQVQDAWNIVEKKGLLSKEVTSWNIHPALTHPAPVGSRGMQANGLCDLFGNVREWIASGESAGFSYDTEGYGSRKQLFYKLPDLQYITGFRCACDETQ